MLGSAGIKKEHLDAFLELEVAEREEFSLSLQTPGQGDAVSRRRMRVWLSSERIVTPLAGSA